MVKNCCLVNCKSEWIANSGITFHCFPKDKNMREKWLSTIPSNLLKNKDVSKYATICSKHFTLNSFVSNSTFSTFRNVLTKDAIPTIFENDNGHIFEISIIPISHDKDIVKTHLIEQEKENLPSVLKADVGMQTAVPSYIILCEKEKKYKQHKKILLKRLQRREKKIEEMTKNIKEMTILLKAAEEKNNSIKILEDAFMKYLDVENRELFLNEIWNNSSLKKSYTENIKQFATTMYNYSPRAYDFLRERLTLPHSATLRKWIAEHNSSKETKKNKEEQTKEKEKE